MRRVAGCFWEESEIEVVGEGRIFHLQVNGRVVEKFDDVRKALEKFEEVVLELRRSRELRVLRKLAGGI